MGKFITFEGGEGSGKSTILERFVKDLESEGYEVVSTREPGGIDTAEAIREVVLRNEFTHIDEMTEALLYAAARKEHLVHKVKPALEQGKVVVCDRFVDSSLVYQGYVRGIGVDEVKNLNDLVIEGYEPDLTFYLDVDPVTGLNRVMGNEGREKNRLDLEGIDFHEKVREGYKLLGEDNKYRWKEIDAGKSIEEVYEQVKDVWRSFDG